MDVIKNIFKKITGKNISLANIDNLNIVEIKSYAEKLGLWDIVLNSLPTELSSKLADGKLTKEEALSLIPIIKNIIKSKLLK